MIETREERLRQARARLAHRRRRYWLRRIGGPVLCAAGLIGTALLVRSFVAFLP